MLKGLQPRLALGIILALALVTGLFVTVAGWYVRQDYRHVRVALSDIDDIAKVAVNCRTALIVGARRGKGEIDLGLLSTDDAVTVSVFNKNGDADWWIHATSNDKDVLSMHSPQASATSIGDDEHTVVMVQSFTAGGRILGPTGCSRPLLVSSHLADYRQSPDSLRPNQPHGVQAGLWPHLPVLTVIEESATAAFALTALLGFVVALTAPGLWPWIRGRWHYGFVVGLLGLLLGLYGTLGPEATLKSIELIGVALLATMAFVHVRAGRAAGDLDPPSPRKSPGRDSNS